MTEKELLNNYYASCNALLEAFCRKQGFNHSYWIAEEIGGVADCDEFFTFGMGDIVIDLHRNAPKGEITKWHEYNTRCMALGTNGCNYSSWLKGCPRLTDEQLESLEKAKADFEEAIRRYKEEGF